jgi:mRNA-degrading endonuclease toxin of MazEF toxin-antitoxin module
MGVVSYTPPKFVANASARTIPWCNDKTSLVVFVSISTRAKGTPFETAIAALNKPSVALSHRVTTADWRSRNALHLGGATDAELADIEVEIKALLFSS